jgi:hypothetical protein
VKGRRAKADSSPVGKWSTESAKERRKQHSLFHPRQTVMREGGQGYPDNRQPQWYGKARRGKAEETDGLKDAIDNDTYKQQKTNHLQVSPLISRKKNIHNQKRQGNKRPVIAPQDAEEPDCLINRDIDE